MNAQLKAILAAVGVTGVNAIPVAGQLFAVFAPIVAGLIQKHQATHDGAIPTVDQLTAAFTATLDQGDAEWAAWVATHPKTPPNLPG